MGKLITIIVIAVVAILVIAYFTGRSKTHSKKSSTEKLASTLHTRFEKLVNDLNKSIRTPEVIQEEMLNAIDEYKLDKLSEIQTTTENLINTKHKLESNKNNIDRIITNQKNRLREIHHEWELDKENETLLNSGAETMRQVDEMTKTSEELGTSIEGIRKQIIEIEKMTANFNAKIETKRGEVLTMISKYIASDCQSNIKFSFNIDDLVSDYKATIEVRQEKAKLADIASSKITDEATPIATEEYINKFKNI